MGRAEDAERALAAAAQLHRHAGQTRRLGADAFDDPQLQYPFLVQVMDEDTKEIVHTVVVKGPGTLQLPRFPGRRVTVMSVFMSGDVQATRSDGSLIQE